MTPHLAGLAVGMSFAAGLNLYATVATLGFLERLGIAHLPPALAPVGHPVVITVALALYAIEFFADKVPYVDTAWDVAHTFIRPPAAAILTYAAVAGIQEPWRLAAALLAGGVALTSHGTKATARAAVNMTPEPISNSMVSMVEDGVAIALVWLAATHPLVTLGVVAALVLVSFWLLVKLYRFFKGLCGRLSPKKGSAAS